MSSSFVVEMDGRVVGLAVRCKGGFRFFASEHLLRPLDRVLFPRVRALLRAVYEKGRSQVKTTSDKQGPSRTDRGGRQRP